MKRSELKRKTPLKQGGSTLKRSPMPRSTSMIKATKPLARGSKPMQSVGQRGKRMRQGKVAPNALEQAWMDRVASAGCIVCWLFHRARRPAEVHHLLSGGRRMGHLYSIPLCVDHHRGGSKDGPFISRHPYKARFEAAYAPELELLDAARSLLGARQDPSPSSGSVAL